VKHDTVFRSAPPENRAREPMQEKALLRFFDGAL
jgi:hypothetical protein